MIKRIVLIDCLLVFIICTLQSQNIEKAIFLNSNTYIQGRFHYGFITPHHESFMYFIEGHTKTFNLEFGKETNGSLKWHKLYKYPAVGFGFCFTDFANPKILGSAYSLYGFINSHLFERKRFEINWRFEIGLAYLSKSFDEDDNVYNFAIGTKCNVHLHTDLNLGIHLTEKLRYFSGIGLLHYSNGAVKLPNNGLNIVSWENSFRYYLCQEVNKITVVDDFYFNRHNRFSVIFASGLRSRRPIGSKPYNVSSISVNFERCFSPKYTFGIGFDTFYDKSLDVNFVEDSTINAAYFDYLTFGGHTSFDLCYGKVVFTIQQGFFIGKKPEPYQNIYQRFGFRYMFSRFLLANITLRTYFAKADFIEWGLGYYLPFGKSLNN